MHRSSTLLLGTIGNIAERIKINCNMDKFNLVVHAARDYKFEYMLLNRLQCDCDYYFGYGGRNAQHCLWAHDEQKQIDNMRELYDLLPVKPEWLTREQIDEYAARMGVK